ncbi:MAG: ferrochelatase [Rhodospirillaceae bacterium]|nr:ferrochelatase [Rhodospirillaceae bacterium]
MARVAVVLLNLGGPDRPEAVRRFLFNLFNDRAIIGMPQPARALLAGFVSGLRARRARRIYSHLGGGSPLLANTKAQARALESALADLGEVAVFCCMRYWHPRSDAVAAEVKRFGPQSIVLLPLYPQFSSTTTASSYRDWRRAARRCGLAVPTALVCCYPSEEGFVEALAAATEAGLSRARESAPGRRIRVLFTAHGLPRRTVRRGDPYPQQVEETAASVARRLELPAAEWVICYQSRVGPLRWIGPSTPDEIRRAGQEGVGVVVVPIAFVSEHSETLVELDIEYARLAREMALPCYVRVPTVGTAPAFVSGLARLVRAATGFGDGVRSQTGPRRCTATQRCCLAAKA